MTLQLARDAALERKPLTYEDMASSKPFLFTIGPNKREFTMPSVLVAAQSPALERLVNGEFKEAQDQHSHLQDIDEETFVRFIEYAYTGKYGDTNDDDGLKEAKLLSLIGAFSEDEIEVAAEPEPEPEPVRSVWSPQPTKKKKCVRCGCHRPTEIPPEPRIPPQIPSSPTLFQPLGEKFRDRVSALAVEEKAPRIAHRQGSSAANSFLAHARVFVFADYWGITRLGGLSLQALGEELKVASIGLSVVRDRVVELIEYCFEDAKPEELVKLVMQYASFKLPHLWVSEKFRGIFEDNKELSVGLVESIVQAAGSG
ncbi:hypothetical protein OQA88_13210 [Cercophora sp. LCS_1]